MQHNNLKILTKSFLLLFVIIFFICATPARAGDRLSYSGSGFYINSQCYMATASHVVKHANQRITVLDGNIEIPAAVIIIDTIKDIAILKVDKDGCEALPSDPDYRVGDDVVAMGFPIPDLMGDYLKMTKGIIVSRDTRLLIHTDAVVHGGNSGGALVDMAGNAIGVVVSGYTADEFGSTIAMAVQIKHVIQMANKNGIPITINRSVASIPMSKVFARGERTIHEIRIYLPVA
jgi:S1-C subfamily serine protease